MVGASIVWIRADELLGIGVPRYVSKSLLSVWVPDDASLEVLLFDWKYLLWGGNWLDSGLMVVYLDDRMKTAADSP